MVPGQPGQHADLGPPAHPSGRHGRSAGQRRQHTLSYDSEDTARSQLFDAEFVAYDGMDEEDALVRGFSLHEVQPPQADSDDALHGRMVQSLGARA